MTQYLQYIPKTLQEDFINNNVIPIVGAGFSKNAIIPPNVTMPDWNQLGQHVASYIMDYEYTNALDALSIFENEYSRIKLIELLAKELHIHEIQPSPTYMAFCDIFYDTICTTNFDFLLDETLQLSKRPVSVIVSEEKLSINMKDSTKLIKLHGDFNHPNNMVITERDYDLFLDNNKLLATYISNLFITKTLFLVGYSFDDNDTRNLWQIINSRLGSLKKLAYCVMVDASRTEISRFERRNIKVINLPGKKEHYPDILRVFFNEIKELISQNSTQLFQTTDNKLKEELILPDEINRLCYIAASHQIISQIKENIFPILSEYSIKPITLDEVLFPSDNWLAKSELLIQKSNLALVDLSQNNSNVTWELTTLLKNNKHIICIAQENSLIDIRFKNRTIIYYKSFDDQDFLLQLQNCILSFVGELASNGIEEANRLFKLKEYNASAISAFRYLEEYIRKFTIDYYKYNRPYSLSLMLQTLCQQDIIHNISDAEIKMYIRLRNELVHTNVSITKSHASDVINFVKRIEKEITLYNNQITSNE